MEKAKRKAGGALNDGYNGARKRSKQDDGRNRKDNLLFNPRPDWHAAELPVLEQRNVNTAPPQSTIDELHKYASSLLAADNATYNASHLTGSSSHKFLSTIMSSGTLEDKVSALTLLVQESPLHNTKAFENLLGLSRKKSRNQALMALAALKDLLGQGAVLPSDRKLRAFGKQPALLGALQGKAVKWSTGDSLPGGIQKGHLVFWAYEDWLKRTYFEVLQVLESWCNDEVEYSRSQAVTYVWELLKDKPEQEENLLRLLVNKLGDNGRKIASKTSHLLLQLETTHPAMKMVITNSIEADCLFRPGQSLHAKYYAAITLNQTILSQKEDELANKLLDIYFSLFVQLLKPGNNDTKLPKPQPNGKLQGGGGKAGKQAAKKRKALDRKDEADLQLQDKMMAQVLTGVNRAFPFADTNDPTFEKHMDTIFRVAHSANFNTAVQALVLIQQISSTKHYGSERFYRTLYESLLDPRICSSSKQIMYLNLLYKSLKADLSAKRVQAFVKRLLQVITLHEPPFICGVLYLISELEGTFPSIRTMMKDAEVDDEDEEEHFVDVDVDHQDPRERLGTRPTTSTSTSYDPRRRDPEYAHADRSCLWDLLPFVRHFHPSVSLFAQSLLFAKAMPTKPDPTQHTLMHFLDRFVYRSARSKPAAGMHGSSIMQPMAGSNAADLLVKPGKEGTKRTDVNTEAFWERKVEDVPADEVFFHSYFNQAGKRKRRTAERIVDTPREDEDGTDEEGEEEIWKAITASKPEAEGPGEDDDLSMDDLEHVDSNSGEESEAGIDLGGGAMEDDEELLLEDGSGTEEADDIPELDSEDGALFSDEDEVPDGVENADVEESEEDLTKNQKKRKQRKKLKQLPTFASVEDYAKLLGNDDDEDEGDT